MAHRPKNPHLPLRDGLAPSCLALPRLRQPPWASLLDCLSQRLPRISRAQWLERLQAGQVCGEDGQALPADAPYLGGERIYYWRELPQAEAPIPFQAQVLHQCEHLVVADKPHFLPVTPGGGYVRETLLVRLKQALGLPNLSPLHRLDRETAGLVLFSVQPQQRDAYQRLFRERRVHKSYEAIAATAPHLNFPLTRRSHVRECEQAFYKMREARPDEALSANSETEIHLLETRGPWARYRLHPVTGKRHQLRVHMLALGLPIVGDQFYPYTLRSAGQAEDYRTPLRLLAHAIAFDDPISGAPRRFESTRQLAWPD
ncbi:MAG: pseudouridine synthase [Pseudomonadota bacterium]|jgi:tRNA pseudouridine32 synthase/23S rRNA pseudouridine746 synthase